MPVSRTRKKKPERRSVQARRTPPAGAASSPLHGFVSMLRGDETAGWFADATQRVLSGTPELLRAGSLRALDAATGRLLGGELDRVLAQHDDELWFDAWFRDVATKAQASVAGALADDAATDGGWRALLRLLVGLELVAPPELVAVAAAEAAAARKQVVRAVKAGAVEPEAPWLMRPPRTTATGRVWLLRAPGIPRLGYVIELLWHRPDETGVILADVDACGLPRRGMSGLFDDVGATGAAWCAGVGAGGVDAEPMEITHPEGFDALVRAQPFLPDFLDGGETRERLEVWYRSRRAYADLGVALRKTGRPLPSAARDDGFTLEQLAWASDFPDWFAAHEACPLDDDDAERCGDVVATWNEDVLPGTERVLTEHRAEWHRAILSDREEGPARIRQILAAWIRFLGERYDQPRDLVDRCVAVALGAERSADACPGMS